LRLRGLIMQWPSPYGIDLWQYYGFSKVTSTDKSGRGPIQCATCGSSLSRGAIFFGSFCTRDEVFFCQKCCPSTKGYAGKCPGCGQSCSAIPGKLVFYGLFFVVLFLLLALTVPPSLIVSLLFLPIVLIGVLMFRERLHAHQVAVVVYWQAHATPLLDTSAALG
jgi:hypothetical protein